ncbi:hypothetical protein R3P38DRAFT_3348606 [Favolaschia claudopus]|uniref:Uncharacterized protein n=1 Tax=Favolaschia claudopus TaxID=2862362 RepID=A0AAW0CUE3_9AGAR
MTVYCCPPFPALSNNRGRQFILFEPSFLSALRLTLDVSSHVPNAGDIAFIVTCGVRETIQNTGPVKQMKLTLFLLVAEGRAATPRPFMTEDRHKLSERIRESTEAWIRLSEIARVYVFLLVKITAQSRRQLILVDKMADRVQTTSIPRAVRVTTRLSEQSLVHFWRSHVGRNSLNRMVLKAGLKLAAGGIEGWWEERYRDCYCATSGYRHHTLFRVFSIVALNLVRARTSGADSVFAYSNQLPWKTSIQTFKCDPPR